MFHLNLWLRREKEISMRHLFIVGAAVVAALGINAGIAEAASAPLDGLATSGLPTIDVRYYRRYPSYYRGRRSSYTSSHCANRDEIRELQRMWPETNWPRSMRCFPYR